MLTYGIYKDWFIYAQYPTPIKGFILRQEGILPAWKADAELTKVLEQFPSEFTSIQVTDRGRSSRPCCRSRRSC